jgi:hypothetical protein
MATGGKIIPRFEDITADKLGSCGLVREIPLSGGLYVFIFSYCYIYYTYLFFYVI